jgi:hypothetical protein
MDMDESLDLEPFFKQGAADVISNEARGSDNSNVHSVNVREKSKNYN